MARQFGAFGFANRAARSRDSVITVAASSVVPKDIGSAEGCSAGRCATSWLECPSSVVASDPEPESPVVGSSIARSLDGDADESDSPAVVEPLAGVVLPSVGSAGSSDVFEVTAGGGRVSPVEGPAGTVVTVDH